MPSQSSDNACPAEPQSAQLNCLEPNGTTDHPAPLRRGARKRTPSVLLQDQSDISSPLTRRRTAVHTPQDDAHLGSAPPQAAPSRQRKPAHREQPSSAASQPINTLLTSDRTVQHPPLISLIPCTDAPHIPPAAAADKPSDVIALTDTHCLPSQVDLAPNRYHRTCGPPKRFCTSPARGRDRHRSPSAASQRPKRDHRARSRRTPSPQPAKRPRITKNPSQPATLPCGDAVMLPASELCTLQQSGLPFDRGKS